MRLDEATANRLQAELGRLRSDDDLVVFDEAFDVAVDRMFAHERDDLGILRFLTAVRRRYQLDDDGMPIPEAEALIRRSLGQRVQVPAMSVSAELGIKGAVFMGVMHELGLSDGEIRASIA